MEDSGQQIVSPNPIRAKISAMETGVIPAESIPGGIDLTTTLESGQTYIWRRSDGAMYAGTPPGDAWYETVLDGAVVRVRQREAGLEWQGSTDVVSHLRRALRLDDDLDAIFADAPADPLIDRAFEHGRGLRLVRDPPVASLISFICSAQMRVPRIHNMVQSLTRTFGAVHTLAGAEYPAFPAADRLAASTEGRLRELKLGYRAPYVLRTAQMIADGEAHPADVGERPYEAAREYLTQFVGVGEKVADCVLLFSLGYLQAVPLDTWIRTAIETHYPDCEQGSYAETSAAIRERFGGAYAGYVQTYVFHFLRTADEDPAAIT